MIVFVHSIPGPDVLRHGQEARDMPAHVFYKELLGVTNTHECLALSLLSSYN